MNANSPVPVERLGDILKAKGYISDLQLEEALAAQKRPGERRLLGQILISRGYVTAARIKLALAKQKGHA